MNHEYITIVLVGLFGSALGSFLNVVIYRLPRVGGTLEYTAVVIPQGINMKPGRHVFLITVKGPDGSIQPFFSECRESVNGILQSSLNISIGDQPGRWILEVRDVTTGKTAGKVFMVMATGRLLSK